MAAKIVLVEDDKFLRDLMSQKLEETPYEIYVAEDGEKGMEKIREQKPDLILLDLILPGVNGFEVLEQLKQEEELSKIPVVVLSNLGQENDIEKAKRLGAEDYMVKAHFTLEEIISKIEKYVK